MSAAFTVIVERDPESTWLIGEVVELPGCYTQAPDMQGLQENIEQAIRAYLQTTDVEEPRPEFVAALRVEVAA